MEGIELETKNVARAVIPIVWYEADIMADAIVSLEWLAKFNIDIRSKEHGVMIKSTAKTIWAKGVKNQI